MDKRNLSILVYLALLIGTIIYARSVNLNLPGVHEGYAPEQPIKFSHRLHSGDLNIQCLYCHTGADRSRHAGIPSANICMNCHKFITARWDSVKIEEQLAEQEKREPRFLVSVELNKLYQAVGYDPQTFTYQDGKESATPLRWIRVYDLPDFVYFDHRRHVNAGVTCERCHGQVNTMERIVQVPDLTMGWCVNCHRDVNRGNIPELKGRFASITCAVCHY